MNLGFLKDYALAVLYWLWANLAAVGRLALCGLIVFLSFFGGLWCALFVACLLFLVLQGKRVSLDEGPPPGPAAKPEDEGR